MKKILLLISILLILLALTGCNDKPSKRANCKHDDPTKIEVVLAKEPTCAETGLTEGKKCLICDKMIVPQSVVPKLDCIEGYWVLDYLPTIDTDGKKHTECVSCGKVIKEEAITSSELLSDVKISAIELIRFCLESVEGENGSAILSEDKMNAIKFISAINTIGRSYYTADEFEEALSIDIMENFGIASYQIKQMYGLYLWDEFTNNDVEFETMLDYLTEISEYPEVKQFMSEETATQLKDLSAGLEEFKEKMNAQLDKRGFVEFCKNEFGNHAWVAPACELIFKMASGGADTTTTIELLSFVDNVSSIIPADFRAMIKNYLYVYDVIAEPCAYTDFIPVLRQVILALTNEEYEIEATAETIQQVYIMYYRERIQSIPNKKIQGIEFIEFINEMIATNVAVASQVSEEDRLMLLDLVIIYDFISDFNTYNYEEMIERTHSLGDSVSSMSGLMIFTDEDVLSIYIHYAINN